MTLDLAADRTAQGDLLRTLDPALRGLAELFDTTLVSSRFEREWAVSVVSADVLRVRYEPGMRCVTTYRLELSEPPAETTIAAIELTPTSRYCRRFAEDRALPGLKVASEAASLVDLLPAATGEGGGWRANVVSYHPGERAVLRYERGGDAPHVLFGKVLADGAAALASTLAGLRTAAVSDPALPLVPALVRLADQLGLVVQSAVGGESLHAWITDSARPHRQRAEAFHLVGAAVGALHTSAPRPSLTATAAADAASLSRYVACVRQADDDLAARVEAIIGRVGRAVASTGVDAETFVPSHGALRTDQAVLVGSRPGLLDLDGYCIAHPARDIGNLLAYLRWRSIRNPADRPAADQAREAFLDGYGTEAARPDDAHVALFEALSLIKIAGRRFRSLSVGEWGLVPSLLDEADALLSIGTAP